jgi:hypothetical protein
MTNEPSQPESRPSLPERKPWPMWPIVVAIIGFMAFYTWVQFSFRKLEQPYLPSEAMKDRTRAAELKNLYGWYILPSERISGEMPRWELSTFSRSVRELPLEEELPSQVVYYLPSKPILIPGLSISGTDAFYVPSQPLHLALQLPSEYANHPDLYLTTLYKENQLLILPELRVETEPSGIAENVGSYRETVYFSMETGPLANPSIDVKLYNATSIYQWQIHTNSVPPAESN